MSLLVIYEILELFHNTLTEHGKYFFFVIATIYRNQFKWNVLKNKKVQM